MSLFAAKVAFCNMKRGMLGCPEDSFVGVLRLRESIACRTQNNPAQTGSCRPVTRSSASEPFKLARRTCPCRYRSSTAASSLIRIRLLPNQWLGAGPGGSFPVADPAQIQGDRLGLAGPGLGVLRDAVEQDPLLLVPTRPGHPFRGKGSPWSCLRTDAPTQKRRPAFSHTTPNLKKELPIPRKR